MEINNNDILKRLNDLHDACSKAKILCDAMQLIQICNNASQIQNYLIFASCYAPYGYYSESISLCNSICDHCNHALNDLANKAIQDAIQGKLHDLILNVNKLSNYIWSIFSNFANEVYV